MKKQKLTPWFRGDVKPVRKGVYQQYSGTGDRLGYQRWDGRVWHSWADNPTDTKENNPAAKCFQNDKWRGLAAKP